MDSLNNSKEVSADHHAHHVELRPRHDASGGAAMTGAALRCEPPRLHARLVLLLAEEGVQTHGRHLHNLETHARNITLGVSGATETRHQHLVVLVNEVQATI